MTDKKKLTAFFKQLCVAILLLTVVFGYTACKKEDTQGKKFYMTCKLNGIKTDFSGTTTGAIIHDNGYTQVTIGGFTDTTVNGHAIGFIVTNVPSQDSIDAGIYADTTTRFEVLGAYDHMDGSLHYDAGTSMYQDLIHYGAPVHNHFIGIISEINAEGIRGTFSGDYYNDGDIDGDIITVTEGEFYVQRY